MRVAMIGSGYVGLVSGACFADFGHQVTCVDKDAAKIARLRDGDIPIFEPDLDRLVAANMREKRLDFTTDLPGPVAEAEAVFIAVGTPSRRGDGHADLSYVHMAAREIAAAVSGFTVVVTKSTVPVGTGDEVERIMTETRPDADVAVVSNPEFLREGAAIQDFKHPDRIVVGTADERAKKVMAELYRPLYLNQAPILYTTRRTAELIKYAANAFLATKITFINEIADLCEKVGGDVQQVARGIGLDNRIGSKFLHAGPGFGGSCFPKDTVALIKTAQDAEAPLRIVETVAAVNDARKRGMARKVAAALGGSLRGKTIAVLGLTFKPNTDDMREAPSIPLITALTDMGARVPTSKEAGLPEFQASPWFALFAPRGTPRPILDELTDALDKGLDDKNTRRRLIELGSDIPGKAKRAQQPLAALVKSEIARWTPIIKAVNINQKRVPVAAGTFCNLAQRSRWPRLRLRVRFSHRASWLPRRNLL